ncbi:MULTISPECIES: GNAT family N-acetyltransferase [Stenotrophomonas]|uniref:GNAT family N-acetyltransferase n=1 Tax=Stenotrophomonas lactitubi TaxID=2045214 RepID=A0AAW4GJ74_9GAMM|nr:MULTISPECIES: GNAT family N-acetyltransferase [Stenotrophomonas]MBM9914429.1 GNAT family N-acetyltransferase [Stenotrophomonas lactitubi]MBM9921670.1 GNAT family N-acetyltransferase [Stenotrophomonas lactitubi]MBM9938778.1 GNAT family N-acetyltransferase [Stenotrophomonas lactitubi]
MTRQAPALQIRAAACTDLPALIALDSVAAHDPRRAVQIGEWLADGHMHVAELDGTLGGYRVQHRHFFGEAFIEMLMVAAPLRGYGIGSALLLHATSISAGTRLFSSTNQSNTSMQRLLAAAGFVRCGIVHGLDEGDPELIYRFATDDVR